MTVMGRFMRLGGMVESSVGSVLTRFDKNRPRFEGGRREEERGLGRIFATPPHPISGDVKRNKAHETWWDGREWCIECAHQV